MSSTSAQARRIGFTEFLVLTAALMATQAIAVDTMLPALPTIAAALALRNENHSQWIVTAYLAGVGCGQLFWGLFSDRYGRRPVLLDRAGRLCDRRGAVRSVAAASTTLLALALRCTAWPPPASWCRAR